MSIGFALDLHTGKMLWRSDKLANQGQRIQMMVQQGQDLSGESIAAAPASLTGDAALSDRVLLVRHDPNQNMFNQPRQLLCLAADTGKTLWSSESSGFLSAVLSTKWDFGGTPLVIGPTAYIVAHAQQQLDANLLAISIKDGKIQWTLPLGTNTQTTNFRGMATSPDAVLARRGSKLYVLTNDGAVLAVDLPSHALDWAFTYPPTPPAYDPRFGFNPMMMAAAVHSAGAMKIVGRALLLKEADNSAMYAIDLTGPSLLWRRPVDGSEMIAHADEQGVLLLGEDLSYMDLASRQLQWSARLPGLGGSVRPLISDGDVDLFLPRGIFEMDSSNGDTRQIFRGYDHDAGGGTLWRAGDRLVAVSNRTITAYPIR
jgi:outer membrane protein assembly factor BamB